MELLGIIARVLKSESLERVMWFIIVWGVLLIFSPDSWSEGVNSKVGIPHFWQVFIFAIAFVAATNTQRFVTMVAKTLLSSVHNRRSKQKEAKISQVISSLSNDEKECLAIFIDINERFLAFEREDKIALSLIDKNILHDFSRHLNIEHAGEYTINPDYYLECVKQFTGYLDR
ncbi:super-infection exclusion protein B [Providencia rustigianii]|uniref:super-infection exclusion protein B n=1 Tax=Providencia rustigianii TaxID=158850 RepID=UPI002240486E|nr:super-infection exclusion protein B [Providencia rustigianii]